MEFLGEMMPTEEFFFSTLRFVWSCTIVGVVSVGEKVGLSPSAASDLSFAMLMNGRGSVSLCSGG